MPSLTKQRVQEFTTSCAGCKWGTQILSGKFGFLSFLERVVAFSGTFKLKFPQFFAHAGPKHLKRQPDATKLKNKG